MSSTLQACGTWKTVLFFVAPETSRACTVLLNGRNSSILMKSRSQINWASFSGIVGKLSAARNKWDFPGSSSGITQLSVVGGWTSLLSWSSDTFSTWISAFSSCWLLGSTQSPTIRPPRYAKVPQVCAMAYKPLIPQPVINSNLDHLNTLLYSYRTYIIMWLLKP